MSVEKSSNKGAGGGRVRSRWQLDFSSRSSHGIDLVSPPGYSAGQIYYADVKMMCCNIVVTCFQVKAPWPGQRSLERQTPT